MCKKERQSGWDGGKAVEEKSLQIINKKSVFAIDNFSWDFLSQLVSVAEVGLVIQTSVLMPTCAKPTSCEATKPLLMRFRTNHPTKGPAKDATADVLG